MKIIFVYDISLENNEDNKRLNKVRKIARKYLYHVQKSVFEGNLTYSKLYKLEREIMQVIDKNRDSIIIYILPDGVRMERKILTNIRDPLDNII